jgi:hypothetical protein
MAFTRERILIWGKTWPELSRRYHETVCTGGVTADGRPVRLHPMPLRYMDTHQRYSLYSWIEVPLERNESDPRPETYRVKPNELRVVEHVGTKGNWAQRREAMFKNPDWQFASLHALDEARRASGTSIGIVSPGQIDDVVLVDRPAHEKREYEEKMAQLQLQPDLFISEYKELTFLEKRIRLLWRCLDQDCWCSGTEPHNDYVNDWGLLELARREGWDKAKAKLAEVSNLKTHELRIFMGTYRRRLWQFGIVGLWYPKLPDVREEDQLDLFN